jgi:hypothetical protein
MKHKYTKNITEKRNKITYVWVLTENTTDEILSAQSIFCGDDNKDHNTNNTNNYNTNNNNNNNKHWWL